MSEKASEVFNVWMKSKCTNADRKKYQKAKEKAFLKLCKFKYNKK